MLIWLVAMYTGEYQPNVFLRLVSNPYYQPQGQLGKLATVKTFRDRRFKLKSFVRVSKRKTPRTRLSDFPSFCNAHLSGCSHERNWYFRLILFRFSTGLMYSAPVAEVTRIEVSSCEVLRQTIYWYQRDD